MAFISNSLPQLKNLELEKVSPNMFDGINIESLKSIIVKRRLRGAWNQSDLEAMIVGLPNIEYFSAPTTETHRMIRAIIGGWTHLRYIKLRRLHVGEEFNELSSVKFKKLKTIEIYKKFFDETPLDLKEDISRVSKQNGFRLIIY